MLLRWIARKKGSVLIQIWVWKKSISSLFFRGFGGRNNNNNVCNKREGVGMCCVIH